MYTKSIILGTDRATWFLLSPTSVPSFSMLLESDSMYATNPDIRCRMLWRKALASKHVASSFCVYLKFEMERISHLINLQKEPLFAKWGERGTY